MFKSSRWRTEKNKVKVVFKLQFHATQVPQLGKDSLMVSLFPVEIGKPTVRLVKSAIQDGNCRWESPIYETVKFMQEAKTGKISEKMYHFIVSTGSSKAGVLGEVSIDFADYFDTIKPSLVSLPLKASSSGPVLHISIERMNGNVDQSRDAEENEIATVVLQDRSLRRRFSDYETYENGGCNSIDEISVKNITTQNSESTGNLVVYKSSDGISASGSESSSEPNTTREIGLKSIITHQGSGSFLPSLIHNSRPHKPTTNAIITNYLEHQRSNTEWSVGSAPDGSVDDSTNSSDDNLMKDRSLYSSDASVEKLRSDIIILARQAEVSELELQTLKKQIVKESKRGQDLSTEVISLKKERDALKQERDQLKAFRKHVDSAKVSSKLHFESDDPHILLQEIRQELNHEKDLNVSLRVQLLKTQESNSELLLAVQDLDEMLEQKNSEISCLSNKSAMRENAHHVIPKHGRADDEEQQALESLVKEHGNARETKILEQKIIDLYSEIEVYRRDKDELEMQMEQLALDYEILKQENHDVLSKLEQSHLQEQLKAQYECSDSLDNGNELETLVESLENELKKQEEDFSTSLVTINELKSQVDFLERELEKQAQVFESDLEVVMNAKVEQEQRAIRAEEGLRKTRSTNANTAERLQEEFRRLSSQMASTFDVNEKLAKKAVTEANELRLEKSHLEERLEKTNEDLSVVKDHYEEKLGELMTQIYLANEQAEQARQELKETSMKLEHQKEREEEMHGNFMKEIVMLKDEIEKLAQDKTNLSKLAEDKEKLQAEIEDMKFSVKESELLVQRGHAERNELEKTMTSLRKGADKLLEELNRLRSIRNEKENMVELLQSDMETLKAQYSTLKHSLYEDELEKEKLRKQVFHLKGELKKKEVIIASNEKKLKAAYDGTKCTSISAKALQDRGSKEVSDLRERIKRLEGQIRLKEEALENSNRSFLEKEKDLQYKIEELDSKMVDLNNNSTTCCEEERLQKEVEHAQALTQSYCKNEGVDMGKDLSDCDIGAKELDQNGIKSTNTTTLNKLLICTSHDGDYRKFDELLDEMALMKERNEFMQSELKDMQERYSELSLRFAEVEGERQQLVMTVRNLKKN